MDPGNNNGSSGGKKEASGNCGTNNTNSAVARTTNQPSPAAAGPGPSVTSAPATTPISESMHGFEVIIDENDLQEDKLLRFHSFVAMYQQHLKVNYREELEQLQRGEGAGGFTAESNVNVDSSEIVQGLSNCHVNEPQPPPKE